MRRGIYKRGNIYWIRYAGLDGRIIFESSGSCTRFREAEALLIKRKQEVKDGKQPEVKRIKNHTFNELVGEYLKWSERQRCFKSKVYWIKHLVDYFGNIPITKISVKLVEGFQSNVISKGRKPATANRPLTTLKHMFTKAVDWEMVTEDVLQRVRKVKPLPENNRRLRYLSKEECQELINCCSEHLRAIVITGLNTGMRKSEILTLKWEQVDLKHGFILLKDTKNGERREIPINETLRNTFLGLTRRLDDSYLFYDPKTNKPYQDVRRSFITACKRAKIQDFKFHDLRHTFASHMVMAGVDLVTVKELLGHKDLKMTLRYSHLAPAHKVKAVDILDKTINKNPEQLMMSNGVN